MSKGVITVLFIYSESTVCLYRNYNILLFILLWNNYVQNLYDQNRLFPFFARNCFIHYIVLYKCITMDLTVFNIGRVVNLGVNC